MNAIPRLLGSFLLFAGLPTLALAQRVEVQLWSNLPEDSFVVYRGQEISLSVKATEDSYVTVQATDENGAVRVLFPNELQRDNFVYGGEEVPIASLRAERSGPVYIEAIAVLSEDFDFRYGEVTPFWNAAWGEFYLDNFASEDERSFPLALGRGDEIREISLSESQDQRLASMIDDDYAEFEELVRDFRDQTYEAVQREDWARSYVDVYVADERELGGSRERAEDRYGRPRYTYASYYDYDSPDFDYEVALTGYGSWFDFRGVRSWQPPTMFTEWRPFVSGYWTETSYGMHWVGYEPWAWVTYHYGSWWYEPGRGWIWIPDWRDYRWTPANCYWQTQGDYFMWYPAPPPRHVAMQLNINVDIDINLDFRRAVVVHRDNFLRPDISKVLEPVERIHNVLRDVRPKFLPEPPGARAIEKIIGKSIPRVELQETKKTSPEGRAQVVIRKPTQMKEPPQVFKELDAKVKKDVLAGKVEGKPAPSMSGRPAEGKPADGKPVVVRPKGPPTANRPSSGPADKAKPVTPPPGAKVGEGKPRPPAPTPTVRPGKPGKAGGAVAPRPEKQAPPRGAGKPAPQVDTNAKPVERPRANPAAEQPRKPPKGEERATPPAEQPRKPPKGEERATPPAEQPRKPPKGEERATPPAEQPRKPPKGEERATPPAEQPRKPPKGEEKATPPAEAKPKPGQPGATPGAKDAKPAEKPEREKAQAKPADGKGGKDAKPSGKGAKDDDELTEEEKKKKEEEEEEKAKGKKPR